MDRDDARQDIFDYIEMFYNPKRRHGFNDKLPPAEFERRYFERLAGVPRCQNSCRSDRSEKMGAITGV
jgi:hypothetical protein